jgi:hypothetical protein
MKPFVTPTPHDSVDIQFGDTRLHLERLSDRHLDEALKMPGTGDAASDEAVREICKALRSLPFEKRSKHLKAAIQQMKNGISKDEESIATKKFTIAEMKEKVAVLDEFKKWRVFHSDDPPVVEKNDCSRLHRFIEACVTRRVIAKDPDGGDLTETQNLAGLCKNTFVVKHDWAAAFSNATGFDGDIRIPYDYCCFEFRISGKSIVAVAWGEVADFKQGFICFADCGSWWYCFENDESEAPLLSYIWQQIRAICISLDAEVATHEVVRAPERLNKKRIDAGK